MVLLVSRHAVKQCIRKQHAVELVLEIFSKIRLIIRISCSYLVLVEIMKNYSKRPKNKCIKSLFLLAIFAILMSTNYMGQALRIYPMRTNAFNILLQKLRKLYNASTVGYQELPLGRIDTSKIKIHRLDTSATEEQKHQQGQSLYFRVPTYLEVWIVFVLVVSNALFWIIFDYLNHRPPQKQCVLLYLHQDLLKILLAVVWIVAWSVIMFKVDGHEYAMEEHHIKLFTYTRLALVFAILMNLNAASWLKLFTARLNVLDLFYSAYGLDDRIVLLIMRCLISILIATFMIIAYTHNWYTIDYYYLQKDEKAIDNLPTGTVVIQSSIGMLLFLCAFSHILQMLWVPTEDMNILDSFHNIPCVGGEGNENNAAHLPRDMPVGESGLHSEHNDGNSFNTNNISTPIFLSKNVMTTSAYLTPMLFAGIVMFLTNTISKEHPWITILIIQVIIGIGVPSWLILRHEPLKIHAKRNAGVTKRRVKEWFERIHGLPRPPEEQP